MKKHEGIINENNASQIDTIADNKEMALVKLYLSTCEMLARHSYDAIAKQQQWNMVSQLMTTENAKVLYALNG